MSAGTGSATTTQCSAIITALVGGSVRHEHTQRLDVSDRPYSVHMTTELFAADSPDTASGLLGAAADDLMEVTRPRRAMPELLVEAPAPLGVEAQSELDDRDEQEWLDWFERQDPEWRLAERDQLMVSGLRAGHTLQAMGDLYGVSRERVRQIAARNGVVMRELREQQKAQRDRYRRRVGRHIYGVSLSHPELTIPELAEWAEVDEDTVKQALEHRVAVHQSHPNTWSQGVSNEELLEALKLWAAEATTHTGDDFTDWALRRGLPGKQTVSMRFGGWNASLMRAGLHEFVMDRGGPRPVISDAEMWASVLQFLRADLQSYSFSSYQSYASDVGLASGATIRVRLGSWSSVKDRARDLLRYAANRDGRWAWAEDVLAVVPGEAPRNYLTSEQALEALRRVANFIDGPVTVQAYEAVRRHDDPNGAIIQDRLGSWINAMVLAGLTERFSGKARVKWERGDFASAPLTKK